jgi:hypothetical protein
MDVAALGTLNSLHHPNAQPVVGCGDHAAVGVGAAAMTCRTRSAEATVPRGAVAGGWGDLSRGYFGPCSGGTGDFFFACASCADPHSAAEPCAAMTCAGPGVDGGVRHTSPPPIGAAPTSLPSLLVVASSNVAICSGDRAQPDLSVSQTAAAVRDGGGRSGDREGETMHASAEAASRTW